MIAEAAVADHWGFLMYKPLRRGTVGVLDRGVRGVLLRLKGSEANLMFL